MKSKLLPCTILAFLFLISLFQPLRSVSANEFKTTPMLQSGASHSVALKEDGTVWTWGSNSLGQLGDGTFEDRSDPVQVNDLSNIVSIAVGSNHSLALKSDGTVWAWGNNSYGQLGDRTTLKKSSPVMVGGLLDIVSITSNGNQSSALKKDGSIYRWGNDRNHESHEDFESCSARPIKIKNIPDTASIKISGYDILALQMDGTIWSVHFTKDSSDDVTMNKIPVKNVAKVASSIAYIMVLNTDGTVWAPPTEMVEELSYIVDITTTDNYLNTIKELNGEFYSPKEKLLLAVKKDGSVWAWGSPSDGFFSGILDELTSTPQQLPQISDAYTVSIGKNFLSVLKKDGAVWCLGTNQYGQLGDGTKEDRVNLVQVMNLNLYNKPEEPVKPVTPSPEIPAVSDTDQKDTVKSEYILHTAEYKIFINNQEYIDTELPILNYNDSTYIPLKKVADLLGVTLTWNPTLNRAEISKSTAHLSTPAEVSKDPSTSKDSLVNKEYKLHKADYKIMIDGIEFIDAELPILNYTGSTYIPLRKVADLLGVTLTWNAELNRAEIARPSTVPAP